MDKFTQLTGIAAPLMRKNVDTDQIIPGTQLLTVGKTGFGEGLFGEWRYDEATSKNRKENPDFVLNREPYRGATILLARENFACGSSRETAAWALRDFGIRCVIAPSFGYIFFSNALKNNLLPVVLAIEEVEELARQVEDGGGEGQITVDLEACKVVATDGQSFGFTLAEVYRQALLQGLDAIDATLEYDGRITAFRERDRANRPWVYGG